MNTLARLSAAYGVPLRSFGIVGLKTTIATPPLNTMIQQTTSTLLGNITILKKQQNYETTNKKRNF